ncbi:hypothetical protein COL154_006712 [Colletotrichum chrysophilum]|nr:hypothetical protein COL154_006712 [Colletotrichum chrysophilum]
MDGLNVHLPKIYLGGCINRLVSTSNQDAEIGMFLAEIKQDLDDEGLVTGLVQGVNCEVENVEQPQCLVHDLMDLGDGQVVLGYQSVTRLSERPNMIEDFWSRGSDLSQDGPKHIRYRLRRSIIQRATVKPHTNFAGCVQGIGVDPLLKLLDQVRTEEV